MKLLIKFNEVTNSYNILKLKNVLEHVNEIRMVSR